MTRMAHNKYSQKSPLRDEEERLRDIANEAADKVLKNFTDPLGNPNEPSALTKEELDFWMKSRGWTPAEFLTHVYRNGFTRMEHRISAAKALLEYSHRKLPQKLELGATVGAITLDAAALSNLSDTDLTLLEKLLAKVATP